MAAANSAHGPGLEGLLLGRVVSKPDVVLLDTLIDKDLDRRNYGVSNATIEATGFKPMYSLDRGIGDLIKGYTMIKNTRYGNV